MLLKIHRPRPGSNSRTSDPEAISGMTIDERVFSVTTTERDNIESLVSRTSRLFDTLKIERVKFYPEGQRVNLETRIQTPVKDRIFVFQFSISIFQIQQNSVPVSLEGR